MTHEEFFRSPSAQEFIREIRNHVLSTKRPPEEIILDETELCKLLRISKRHAADLRKEGKIKYSKDGGKIYYLLSWVLEYVSKYQVQIPESRFKNIK